MINLSQARLARRAHVGRDGVTLPSRPWSAEEANAYQEAQE